MIGDWLSPNQAAAALSVGPRTVAAWADAGHIAFTLTPTGQRRYARVDVEAFDPPGPRGRLFWLEVDGVPVRVRAEIGVSPRRLAQLARAVAAAQDEIDRGAS